MKNPEISKFVLDNLNTEKMCKHAVKIWPYLLKNIPDQYKTQQMCNKAILDCWTIKSVPDCYKNQEICS